MMTPERWQEVERLFHAARGRRPGEERAAYLAEACRGDDGLREEVESLLAQDDSASDFIEAPAVEVAAWMIARELGALAAGDMIDRYRIVSRLGGGGMGEVYLARDTRLGRRVALKVLPAEFAGDRFLLRRFEQEARAASALSHPNIAHLYEQGEAGGRHFITMEYVEGETLRRRMADGRLSVGEALDICMQVASALSAAHECGVVHRDVKPENIMVRLDGSVKVLDFGLAKVTGPSPGNSQVATLVNTGPGVVMGTTHYMSPEQARGQETDARTDVWSLGVVLYEMVSGHVPFEGATQSDIVAAILKTEPTPIVHDGPESLTRPVVHAGQDLLTKLERVVLKALRKDREERYQNVKDLLQDLKNLRREWTLAAELERSVHPAESSGEARAFSSGRDATARTAGESARRTRDVGESRLTSGAGYIISKLKRPTGGALVILATLVLAVAGTASVFFKLLRQDRTKIEPPETFQKLTITRLTGTGKAGLARISPDGKYVAYVVSEGGKESLWIRQVATATSIQIIPPALVVYGAVAFSPDGNYIYYQRAEKIEFALRGESGLYQLPSLGGASRKLIDGILIDLSFSPDGEQIAFVRLTGGTRSELRVANADGSGERKLSMRLDAETIAACAWSPDGKRVASFAGSYDAGFNLVEVKVEDGEVNSISPQRWRPGGLAWVGDGSGLVVTGTYSSDPPQIWLLSYPGGDARKMTTDLSGYGGVSLTSDSNVLVTTQGDLLEGIWVAPNGSVDRAKQITTSACKCMFPSWTPDGKIVYASWAWGATDVWMMEPDGTSQRQLTVNVGRNEEPSVTPDGRYIVFVSDRTGERNIWRTEVDGSNPTQLTRSSGGGLFMRPVCSPDSKWVVYTSGHVPNETLWKVPIDGGDPVQLTEKRSAYPAISPDGKLIACYYWGGPNAEGIALIPFEGGSPLRILRIQPPSYFPADLRWTPDGNSLTYTDIHGTGSNIWYQPLDGNPSKPLSDFKDGQPSTLLGFDWSRDGGQLAFSRRVPTSDIILIKGFR